MKELPILFSGAMVRALLNGSKTQTRRPVKGMALEWLTEFTPEYVADTANFAPFGVPGDRLWVRETCVGEELESGQDGVRYLADDAFLPIDNTPAAGMNWLKLHTYCGHSGARIGPSVPSIHMPRWACRILLEVTSVRIERLHAIGTADIIAEGLSTTLREHDAECDLQDKWRALWESTGGDWNGNPWVWVVEFKRVQP